MLAIIIAAIVAFILLIPIKAVFEINNGKDFYIKVLFIKIRRPKKKKSKKKKASAAGKKKKTKPFDIIKIILAVKEDIEKFIDFAAEKCTVIEQLSFKLDFGLGDAAQTGIATGGLNAAVYSLVSVVHHKTVLKEWKIDINPDFQTEKFHAEFLCIARTRLLHIIRMGIKGYKLYRKV